MYALQGDNLLAQTLESENLTGYARRLAHELVHQAIKADPTLLAAIQPPTSYAQTTQDSPVSRFVRYRKSQETKRNIDSYLHNVTPRFLTKMIHFLQVRGYKVALTVTPRDAEEKIVYGGTSHEARLSLWVNVRNAGHVFIAEGKTRNKSEIAVVIAATRAEYKTRIGRDENAIDLYTTPMDDVQLPKKFHLWE